MSTTVWLELAATDFDHPTEEELEGGVVVRRSISPYDVPIAVSGVALGKGSRRVIVEFGYRTATERGLHIEAGCVDVVVGRRSGRILRLDCVVDASEQFLDLALSQFVESLSSLVAYEARVNDANVSAVLSILQSRLSDVLDGSPEQMVGGSGQKEADERFRIAHVGRWLRRTSIACFGLLLRLERHCPHWVSFRLNQIPPHYRRAFLGVFTCSLLAFLASIHVTAEVIIGVFSGGIDYSDSDTSKRIALGLMPLFSIVAVLLWWFIYARRAR